MLKTSCTTVLLALMVLSLNSCKTKKIAQAPPVKETPAVVQAKPEPEPEKAEDEEKEEPATAINKANYDFKTIQFEFNSAVLKTFSYPVLDQIAKEMKKDASVKFDIDGHSSAEGSLERNQTLSSDRANSVKSYLVSSGVSASSLIAAGFGESKPITENKTEAGKAQNRRVEIKKAD